MKFVHTPIGKFLFVVFLVLVSSSTAENRTNVENSYSGNYGDYGEDSEYYYDDYYYDDSDYEISPANFAAAKIAQSNNRADLIMESTYDENYEEGEYDDTGDWETMGPVTVSIAATTTPLELLEGSGAILPTTPTDQNPNIVVNVRGSSDLNSSITRDFYHIRINITSLLYDPALEDSKSHLYQQVTPKVRNAFYQEVLNKIAGAHTIVNVKYGKPSVLANIYITTESGAAGFKRSIRDIMVSHFKSGVIGEFIVEKSGFLFKKINASDAGVSAFDRTKKFNDDNYGYGVFDSSRSDVRPLGGEYVSTNVNVYDGDNCQRDQIFCDGRCATLCDGFDECIDGRDEDNCPANCSPDEKACGNQMQCVRYDQWCDGRVDCDDRSDETECAALTLPSASNQVVRVEPARIDAQPGQFVKLICHVGDLPAESFVTEWFRVNERPMPLGTSIDGNTLEFTMTSEDDAGSYMCRCNGAQTVATVHFKEEARNQRVRIEPATLYANIGTQVELTCFLEGAGHQRNRPVSWSRVSPTGHAVGLPRGAYYESNKLIFTPRSVEDGGQYHCRIEGVQGSARITVSNDIPGVPSQGAFCRDDERRCPDGTCFPNDKVCDGDCDCSGCDDEVGCNTNERRTGSCHPNEWRCKRNRDKCIVVYWRCDGQDDCSTESVKDNSDEEGCLSWRAHSDQGSCSNFTMWQCADRRQCVQRSWLCADDRAHVQCRDGSDYDCTGPRVIEPPVKKNVIPEGGTLKCKCVTDGRPFPMIVWRYNWQHLPDDERVKVIDYYNGTSELIITDVSKELEGAYTCEALNLKDRVLAVPDCQLIVEGRQYNCPRGSFNSAAKRRQDCKKCWCSGVTDRCSSSDLYIDVVRIDRRSPDVVDEDNTETDRPGWRSERGMWVIDDYEREFDAYFQQNSRKDLYVRIPGNAVESWLSSYGGYLNYSFSFTVHRPPFSQSPKADVLLIRKTDADRQKVYYNYLLSSVSPVVAVISQDNKRWDLSVRIIEGEFDQSAWRKIKKPQISSNGANDVSSPPNLVGRDEFMHALANLEAILVRISYAGHRGQRETKIGNIELTTAGYSGSEPAVLVEKCECPPGYLGMSCERCDRPRYFRNRQGKCVKCMCHNHADTCDESGRCINCQHNTEGDQCERCKPGFVGNARQGTPEDCQSRREACHPLGSLTKYPDPATDRCKCKPGVTGRLCDQCMPGYFHLHDAGCLRCFCSGHNVPCTSSSWNRKTIVADFNEGQAGGFNLAEMTGLTVPGNVAKVFPEDRPAVNLTGRVQFDRRKNEIYFDDFSDNENGKIFWWRLPSQFNKYKVTAYGGKLKFTVSYKSAPGSRPISSVTQGNVAATKLVRLYGNNFELLSKLDAPELSEFKAPDYKVSFDILINEANWLYISGDSFQEKSREELLMALSDVSHIHILATFGTESIRSDISDVSIMVADRYGNGDPAPEVEMCQCDRAPHTEGTSCELCKPGYYHSIEGLYLGTCKPCRCHNHAKFCEDRTGYCIDCQHNTEGDYCEMCKPGYSGDARRGTPYDCQLVEKPKPVVRIHQGKEIFVRQGDRLRLTCTLTGAEGLDGLFTWQRNPPGGAGLESKIRDVGGSTLELVIEDAQWSDAGEYNCRYDHPDGSTVDYTRVSVIGLEIEPTNANVKEGESHTFECRTLGFVMTRLDRIDWTKDRSQLPEGVRLLDNQGKRLEIGIVDSQHEGEYTCRLSAHGLDLVARGHLKMIADVVHPFVRFDTTHYYAYKGENVKINCSLLQGKPIVMFHIRRVGENNQTLPFLQDQRVDKNGEKSLTLNIDGFVPEHAGAYSCEAYGSEGRSSAIVVVRHVELEVLPGSRQNMRVGQEIEFACQIKGEEMLDEVDIIWVDAADPERVISNSNTFVLKASRHSPNHISRLCVAKRRSDNCRIASTPLDVNIYHPRPHSLRVYIELVSPGGPRRLTEDESIRIKVGDRLELWCVAEGFPKPGAQFEAEPHRPLRITHQNSESPLFFSPLGKPEESRTVAKLVINSIGLVDRGAFVCSGRNGRGRQQRQANVRVNVEVVSDPIKLQMAVEPEPLRVGSRVTITCAVSDGPKNKILEINSPTQRQGGDVEVYQTDGVTRLVISALQSSHAGVYTCFPRGDSSNRISKSVVVVTIQGPEDIPAGGSGALVCRADGLPDSLVLGWVREHGRPIPSKHSFDELNGILTLNSFEQSDSGSYVCQIKNVGDGRVVAEASIGVTIRMIQFEVNIGRPERIYLTEEINLHCVPTHGVVLVSAEWAFPRGSVSLHHPEASNARCADHTCQQLIIIRWDDADNGPYRCSATDRHGNSGSAEVDLTHRGIRDFSVQIVAEGRPLEDRRFVLTCGGESSEGSLSGQDGRRVQINFRREDGRGWEGIAAENNQLIFERLSTSHSGVFACEGDDGYGNRAVDRYTLHVIELPRFTTDPDTEINLFVGERLVIDCLARGAGRLSYVIEKEGRVVAQDEPSYMVDRVEMGDAGRYRCEVSNEAGSAERNYIVRVYEPVVEISVHPINPIAGQPCEIRCVVEGLPPDARISDHRWYRDDRLVHQGEAFFIISSPAVTDSGTYACEVSIRGLVFTGRSHIEIVGIPPEITISPPDSVITVIYGETLVLNCSATGQPDPVIRWSGPSAVEHELRQSNGILKMRISSIEFGGHYTCSAENSVGRVTSRVRVMIIGGPPMFDPSEVIQTALVGSNVRIDCGSYLASSDPDIRYTWSLKGGRPITTSRAMVQHNVLEISECRLSDEMEYQCVAENTHGTAILTVRLYVERRLPSFRQGSSYMKIRDGIQKPADYLSIEMTFRPESPNGRVLYKGGQDDDADFFCIAMRDSQLFIEATAGASKPISGHMSSTLALNKWHTVQVSRRHSQVTVVVDGSSKTLTLPKPNDAIDFRANFMFLGALPRPFVPKRSSMFQSSQSFIGAISRLKIQERVIDFSPTSEHYDAVDATFESFQTCQVDAVECQNAGICQNFDNARGFRCVCQPGSFGEFCERQTPDKCYKALCGEGICLQKSTGGYQCLCPAGFQGRHCEIRDVVITVPEFNITSFVRTTLKDFQASDLRVGISFRPLRSGSNGQIVFFAQSSASSDFFLLSLTSSGHVRFSFSVLGSAPSTIESDATVDFNDWNSAIAECDQNGGQLIVNGGKKKVISAPVSGRHRSFYIGVDKTVYVGGIDPTMESLTSHSAISGLSGFTGCVKWLYHGSAQVPLLRPEGDASGTHQVAAYHVAQCSQPSTSCDARPCQNNGLCHDKPSKLHYCSCQTGFHGENCQNIVDVCLQLQLSSTPPCSPPNGECVAGEKVYKCSCKLPYHGENCEYSYNGIPSQPAFVGTGWLELERSVFTTSDAGSPSESVSLEFRTSAEHGVLLWFGQPPNVYGDVADFMAIAVTDGHLHARVRLNPRSTSTLAITSVNRVDDGVVHTVVIERRGGSLQMRLDSDQLLGQSFSSDVGDTDLNANGNVYIGGAPKLDQMSGGAFFKHFDGCVQSLKLNGRSVNFASSARDGRDVRECSAIRSRFYFSSRSRRYNRHFLQ